MTGAKVVPVMIIQLNPYKIITWSLRCDTSKIQAKRTRRDADGHRIEGMHAVGKSISELMRRVQNDTRMPEK